MTRLLDNSIFAAFGWKTSSNLAHCGGPTWSSVILQWLVGLAHMAAMIWVPIQLGETTKLFVGGAPTQTAAIHVIATLLMAQIAVVVFRLFRDRLSFASYDRAIRKMTKSLFRTIAWNQSSFFRDFSVQQINTRILEETGRIVSHRLNVTVKVPLAIVLIAVLSGVMIVHHWFLAFCCLPLAFLSMYPLLLGSLVGGQQKELQERWENAKTIADETASNFAEFQSHGVVNYALDSLFEKYDAFSDSMLRFRRMETYISAIDPLILAMQLSLLYFLGASLCFSNSWLAKQFGQTSWPVVIEFMFLVRLFQKPVQGIAQFLVKRHKALQSIIRVGEMRSSNLIAIGGVELDAGVEVQLASVTVAAHTGKPIIQDLDLSIGRGQRVGLIGPSGCGKSTAVSLLNPFSQPTSGQVLINGRPMKQYDPISIGRAIACLPQQPVLIDRSIRENILLGIRRESNRQLEDGRGPIDLVSLPPEICDRNSFEEYLLEVVADVGLDQDLFRRGLDVRLSRREFDAIVNLDLGRVGEFVRTCFLRDCDQHRVSELKTLRNYLCERFGMVQDADADVEQLMLEHVKQSLIYNMVILVGLETNAGRSGNELSGGQRQKVALARALLKAPSLFVMDEALASLDSISKGKITSLIKRLSDATVLSVSHDLSELIEFERIFHFQEGIAQELTPRDRNAVHSVGLTHPVQTYQAKRRSPPLQHLLTSQV